MEKSTLATIIIDRIGGTTETAELCDVGLSAVSGWRTRGIPDGRMGFLRKCRPDAFVGLESYLPGRKYAPRNRRRGRPRREVRA